MPLLTASHAVQVLFTQAGELPEHALSLWQFPEMQEPPTQMNGAPPSPPYAALQRASSVVVVQAAQTFDAHKPLATVPASVSTRHAVWVPVQAGFPSKDGPSPVASAVDPESVVEPESAVEPESLPSEKAP